MSGARKLLFLAAIAAALWLGAGAAQERTAESAGDETGGAPRGAVIVADIAGAIGPASRHHISEAIDAADERGAEALVIQLNTPGGLVTSTRDIIGDILASKTPVVIYVAPSGGHAASAGTFILYAAHVAAMAPGTNVGAATPVQMGGLPTPTTPRPQDEGKDAAPEGSEEGSDKEAGEEGDTKRAPPSSTAPTDAMSAKATNDAAAYIRSLAELRGRNADWAEKAVREADSLSADAALEMGVIDFVAKDLAALLDAIDGRQVETASGERTLATAEARIERLEQSFVTKALAVLANPNVAFMLLMLGMYGLIFELANPGIGPGVPGAICLVLGLYALNQLPLDYAGLALVALGMAFMVAEAATPAFGIFGVGGLVAFTIGAAMLFDTDIPEYQLSWTVIAVSAALSGLILILLLGLIWRSSRRPPQGGARGLIGAEAEVLDWSGGEGHVWAHGERWDARADAALAPGDKTTIADIDGLTLTVKPVRAGRPGSSA